MGSALELNDTLQITIEQGFPADILDLARHQHEPIRLEDVKDQIFAFRGKLGVRIFQTDPVRVFFVQNINGKWLFWGKIFIQSQTIEKVMKADGSWAGEWATSGTYKVVDIYEPDYQVTFTRRESPPGKSFF